VYVLAFIFGIHTVRGVYYPYMIEWGGISFFEIMILQSYFTLMIFLLEIPSGAIADYLGRKKAIILAALTVSLAAFFYSIYPLFLLFVIAETLWAFSSALFSGTFEAFVFSSLKTYGEEKKLPQILARFNTINLVALTLSAPLGALIASLISLQFTMTTLGFIYLIGFLLAFWFKEAPFKTEQQTEKYIDIIKEGFRELRRNKILRILMLDRLFINVFIAFLFWIYQPYLTSLGVNLFWMGIINSLMNITNMFFTLLIPKMMALYKNKLRFLIMVDLINAIAYILIGIFINVIIGIIMILMIVAFGYPRFLIYTNAINNQIASENRATVLSTINMFSSILRAIMYPIIGVLGEINVYAVFLITGLMILIFTVTSRVKKEYLE
jgi:MFS family permease